MAKSRAQQQGGGKGREKEASQCGPWRNRGRRNKEETEREQSKEFRQLKRQHSAVESGINALEIHGLDKCPDHGVDGFRRYVSLAVLARNIQKLGAGLREREHKRPGRRKAA